MEGRAPVRPKTSGHAGAWPSTARPNLTVLDGGTRSCAPEDSRPRRSVALHQQSGHRVNPTTSRCSFHLETATFPDHRIARRVPDCFGRNPIFPHSFQWIATECPRTTFAKVGVLRHWAIFLRPWTSRIESIGQGAGSRPDPGRKTSGHGPASSHTCRPANGLPPASSSIAWNGLWDWQESVFFSLCKWLEIQLTDVRDEHVGGDAPAHVVVETGPFVFVASLRS